MNELKIYWYELTMRGLSPGAQPRDAVFSEPRHVNSRGRDYGAVAYSRQLTEDELFTYDLDPIEQPRDLYDYELHSLEKLKKEFKQNA